MSNARNLANLLGTKTKVKDVDVDGTELVLDADGDTSITADTDDQIDIRIGGADDFAFKANTFEVQTGSNIDMNGTELILDADGDTSITADTDDQVDFKIGGTDRVSIAGANIKVLTGNIQLGASGSETGQIEINSTRLLLRSTGDASGLRFDGSAYTPFKNGSQADGTVDLGSASGKYKDLYLSSGLYVGGTGSANHLDDYEEGIWTVSFPCTTSGSYTVRSGYATGYYRKIGNTVTVALRFETQGESSPVGNIQIGGFPFTFTNTDPSGGLESFHYPILLRGYSANDANMGAFVNPQGGTNNALLYMQHSTNDTGFDAVTPSDVANFEGSVCFTYITTL